MLWVQGQHGTTDFGMFHSIPKWIPQTEKECTVKLWFTILGLRRKLWKYHFHVTPWSIHNSHITLRGEPKRHLNARVTFCASVSSFKNLVLRVSKSLHCWHAALLCFTSLDWWFITDEYVYVTMKGDCYRLHIAL